MSRHGGHAMGARQGFGGRGALASTRGRRHRGGGWGWGTPWDPTWNPSLVIIDGDDDEGLYADDPSEDDTSANMMMSSSNLSLSGRGVVNGLDGYTARPCCAKCAGTSGSCSRSSGALSGITGAVHAIGDITTDILTSPIALVAAGGLVYMMITHAKRARTNPARRRRRRGRARRSR